MQASGVYEILNTVNGKRYVGSTVNMKKRWSTHRRKLRAGGHHSQALQRAWNKYGEESFKFKPILTCAPTKQMLLFYEQQLLDKVKPEYNIADTAGSTLGIKLAESVRAKMSSSALKRVQTTEGRKNLFVKGAIRGPQSAEHIEKRVAPRRGVPCSEEARQKMSASHIGKPMHPATRAAIAIANHGNTHTKGRKLSLEHVAAMRAGYAAYQAAKGASS